MKKTIMILVFIFFVAQAGVFAAEPTSGNVVDSEEQGLTLQEEKDRVQVNTQQAIRSSGLAKRLP